MVFISLRVLVPRFSWIALLVVLGQLGCDPPPTTRSFPIEPEPNVAVFIEHTVPYCWTRPTASHPARVQVLVDASGSMLGHRQIMPRLSDWLRKGVSQLRGATLAVEEYRMGYFTQQRGVFNTTDWNEPPASFDPRGDTNLHEALRTTSAYDLSFVLTDGVAATGSGGSGDCSGGVDAACVARALREAVHEGETGDVDRGIWIIPLMTTYSGKFFTEERLDPSTFEAAATREAVETDLATSVVVQNPSTAQGRLTFDYEGPRPLLLFIIAKETEIGRAAAYALWRNAEGAGLKQAHTLEELEADVSLAMLQPIEIYPGLLSRVTWDDLTPIDDPDLHVGTQDVSFDHDATVRLECFGSEPGKGAFLLSGSTEEATGGCVEFVVLPAARFSMQGLSEIDQEGMDQVLIGYKRENVDYDSLRLYIECPAEGIAQCDVGKTRMRWTAQLDYNETANCLADENCMHPGHRAIRMVSTNRPSLQPHRIFEFSRLLEQFYRQVSDDQRRLILADLNVCAQE